MLSKTSTSFKPILGFYRAQFHNFLFSALIFTIIMVGISFACGSNALYNYIVQDISYFDPRNINFAAVISVAAFIFAAFTFKPFMAKNESDTFLSLPIKKTSLLVFQIIFGIICIIISSLISFGLVYPALNLTKFTSISIFTDSLQSIFCEIVLPMCIFYLISVILIMGCKNFFSGFLLLVSGMVISFFTGSYINANIGSLSLGADITEITDANQTFYFSSSIFLPTRFIMNCVKAVFPVTYSNCNMYVLSNIINLVMLVFVFILFVFAAKKVILGELNRPFAIKPMLKILPIALLLCASSVLYDTLSPIFILIISLAAAIICGVLFFIYNKNIKMTVVRFVACAIICILPLSIFLTNRTISDKITYSLPNSADVDCVYINTLYPATTSQIKADFSLGATYSYNRFCYTTKDEIDNVIKLHSDILDNIKKYKLTTAESVNLDEEMMLGDENYFTDEFETYRESLSKVYADSETDSETGDENVPEEDEYDGEWGLFDQSTVGEDYWSYMFDYDMTTDIMPNQSLPIVGNETISATEDEPIKYTAYIYYKMKDGHWLKRCFMPIPASWIKDDMIKIITSDEYIKKAGEEQ